MAENDKPHPVTLKCKKEVIVRVKDGDLDDFVREVYGLEYKPSASGFGGQYPYEFVPSEESHSDNSHSFTVTAREPDEWDRKKIAEMQSGQFAHFITGTLLDDMCHRGLIEAGKYIIDT